MAARVTVLKVGQVEVPGPELFWMSNWDQWHTLFFNVVLVQGGGFNLLVNTGPPEDLSPINDMWTSVLGERSRYVRAEEDRIDARLAGIGLTPEQVTHVVVTPFQLYTTGGLLKFPNAQVCVSKRGWVHYHTTHGHPHDSRWHSIARDVLVHLVTDGWDNVRLLEDEDEVLPGIRTWWAGTHHRATLAVEVDTDDGVVVASDAFFYYENVEDNRVLGITENMYEALAAYERTRRVADHIVPLYDPTVYSRYPGGRVTGSAAATGR